MKISNFVRGFCFETARKRKNDAERFFHPTEGFIKFSPSCHYRTQQASKCDSKTLAAFSRSIITNRQKQTDRNCRQFKINNEWASSIGPLDEHFKKAIGIGLDAFILLDTYPWLAWQKELIFLNIDILTLEREKNAKGLMDNLTCAIRLNYAFRINYRRSTIQSSMRKICGQV